MKQLNLKATVAAISSVLPARRPIEHHEPLINGYEQAHIQQCFEEGVTSYGYIKRMESQLRMMTDQYVLLVNSGTAALEVALRVIGVQPNTEVLMPALTFVGTANAVSHIGAIPNFIDGRITCNAYKLRCYLARETLPSPDKRGCVNKRTERPITALIVVQLLGMPADMAALQKVADDFGLTLIEDAAEAVGSTAGNRACGSFGAMSTFSFNNNKIVTTGGGGAILSSDEWSMAKAYQLSTTARLTHLWEVKHDAVAWNYRLPNICAAIGFAQLQHLGSTLSAKRTLHKNYEAALEGCEGLSFVKHPVGSNCWLTAVLVDDPNDRDHLLHALHEQGIKARAIFTPMHRLEMYSKCPRDNLGYADHTADRMVCLPSGAGLA